MQISGNTVVITGGGSGIGLALAKGLVDSGNKVIITGRNQNKLDEAKRQVPGLQTVQSDVTSNGDRENLVELVTQQYPEFNVLVNNAGISHFMDFATEQIDPTDVQRELSTNIIGPVDLTSKFMPHLLDKPIAAIVNVSSALAYVPYTKAPIYAATKAALHSFTQSLRHQLRGTSVEVFEVMPPLVDTEMVKEINIKRISPERLAADVLKGLHSGRYEIRTGQAKSLYLMSRVAPGFIFSALNKGPKQAVKVAGVQPG